MTEHSGENEAFQEDENAILPTLSKMEIDSGNELAADKDPPPDQPRESRSSDAHTNESPESLEASSAPPSKKKKNRKKRKSKASRLLPGTGSLPVIPTTSEGPSVPSNPENRGDTGQHLGIGGTVQNDKGSSSPGTDPLSQNTHNLEKPRLPVENQTSASTESNAGAVNGQEAMEWRQEEKDANSDSHTNVETVSEPSHKETAENKDNQAVEGSVREGSKKNKNVASGRPESKVQEKSNKKAEKDSTERKDEHREEGLMPQKPKESSDKIATTSESKSEDTSKRGKGNAESKTANLDQPGSAKGKPNKENENKTKKGQAPNKGNDEKAGESSTENEEKTEMQEEKGSEKEAEKGDGDKGTSSNENQKETTKTPKGAQNNPADSGEGRSGPARGETQSKENTPASRETKQPEQKRFTRASDPANNITVYFHVIVSNDFNINPDEDKVVVVAGVISDWKEVCEMHFTRTLENHGFLLEGQTKIHTQYRDRNIPYKYLIMRKGKDPVYEYIYYADKYEQSHVNRCLVIPKTDNNSDWHQYDDICMKENKGVYNKIKSALMSVMPDKYRDIYSDIYKAKEIAGEVMLDSIFSILSTCDEINLSSFNTQLWQFYNVYTNCYVFSGRRIEWSTHGFVKAQVNGLISKTLWKILAPFLQKEEAQENAIIKDRVVAGMVCLAVTQLYGIGFSNDDLGKLCSILCLEEKPREHLLKELESIKSLFSKFPGTETSLRTLCQTCINRDVDQWIWVLPLLHTFSSVYYQNDSSTAIKWAQDDVWAGLEGLEYNKLINRYSKRDLLQQMVKKKHLLQADRALIRSWLFLVPVEQLNKFFEEIPITILDGLKACCYKFPRWKYLDIENSSLPADVEDGHIPEGWLIGDSGYPLKTWLITPYRVPEGRDQEAFNLAHQTTRSAIERCFGILKMRFRCLDRSGGALQYDPNKAALIIMSCAILHNIAQGEGILEDLPPEAEPDEMPVHPHEEADDDDARHLRQRIVHDYFTGEDGR